MTSARAVVVALVVEEEEWHHGKDCRHHVKEEEWHPRDSEWDGGDSMRDLSPPDLPGHRALVAALQAAADEARRSVTRKHRRSDEHTDKDDKEEWKPRKHRHEHPEDDKDDKDGCPTTACSRNCPKCFVAPPP